MKILFIYLFFLITQVALSMEKSSTPFSTGQNLSRSASATTGKQQQLTVGAATSPKKHVWDIVNEVDWIRTEDSTFILDLTTIVYGFTDWFGLQFQLPIFLKNQDPFGTTRGVGDINIQLSFSIKDKINNFQLTTGPQFPTGSINKKPVTSTGSIDWVGELFASHDSEYWYGDAALDWDKTSEWHHQKQGSSLIWFLTWGPKVRFKKKSPSQFYLLVGWTGIYEKHVEVNEVIDPNTGSQVIFIGPFVSWLRKDFLLEGTWQIPIGQALNGDQGKYLYRAVVSMQIEF